MVSKWDTMKEASVELSKIEKQCINGVIEQGEIEIQLKLIDDETELKVKDIKSTPFNKELTKRQALAELNTQIKHNARKKAVTISTADEAIKRAEEQLADTKRKDAEMKETAVEVEERDNLFAQQEYDKIVASCDNADQVINLRIERVRNEAERNKLSLKTKLNSIKTKNEAQSSEKKIWQTLYDDTKEVAIKLGDTNK